MTPMLHKPDIFAKSNPEDLGKVVIIAPFRPLTTPKIVLLQNLERLKAEAERKLDACNENSKCVAKRLCEVISQLDFQTNKKSVVIMIAGEFSEVLYLSFEVAEAVYVNRPFRMTDIIDNKQYIKRFLLMMADKEWSQTYQGEESQVVLIKNNIRKDGVIRKGNSIREIPLFSKYNFLTNFLKKLDNELSVLLSTRPHPVFFVGSPEVIDLFKKVSNNTDSIIDYLPKEPSEVSPFQLPGLMQKYFGAWKKVQQRFFKGMIKRACNENLLNSNEDDLYDCSPPGGCLLLIKKENGRFENKASAKFTAPGTGTGNRFYLRTRLDVLLHKVLKTGGNAEYVDENVLEGCNRLALISQKQLMEAYVFPSGRHSIW